MGAPRKRCESWVVRSQALVFACFLRATCAAAGDWQMTDLFVRGVRERSMTVPFPPSRDRFRGNVELSQRAAFRPSLPSRSQIMAAKMAKLQRLRVPATRNSPHVITHASFRPGGLCYLKRQTIAALKCCWMPVHSASPGVPRLALGSFDRALFYASSISPFLMGRTDRP